MVAISYLAGTIAKDEMFRFKKMVFRATRGKALTYFRDLDQSGLTDYTGALDNKLRTVYVIVFQEGQHLRSRLQKICDSFMGRSVEIPHSFGQQELVTKLKELDRRILEAKHIIGLTRMRLKDYLKEMQKASQRMVQYDANSISLLEIYRLFLQKEKTLYSTLNKFKKEDKLFLGFCWIPRAENLTIMRQVESMKEQDRNIETPTLKVVNDHGVRPPSLFKLNEVTWVF